MLQSRLGYVISENKGNGFPLAGLEKAEKAIVKSIILSSLINFRIDREVFIPQQA